MSKIHLYESGAGALFLVPEGEGIAIVMSHDKTGVTFGDDAALYANGSWTAEDCHPADVLPSRMYDVERQPHVAYYDGETEQIVVGHHPWNEPLPDGFRQSTALDSPGLAARAYLGLTTIPERAQAAEVKVMSKHSGAPWTLDPEGEHAIEIEDASGEVVGAAYGSGAVAEANAMLIASAPDLLAALQQAVALYEAAPKGWAPREWLQKVAGPAIAKATGGES